MVYDQFLEKVITEFMDGISDDLPNAIDSFYAGRKNISQYGLFRKYLIRQIYYARMHKEDIALINMDSAMALLENNHLQNELIDEYLDVLNTKGALLYNKGRLEESYNCYFKYKQIAEKLKDSCKQHINDYNIAMIYYKDKKYDRSIEYFKDVCKYHLACDGENAYLQEILDNIALCYEKKEMFDTALYYYDSALSYIFSKREKKIKQTFDRSVGIIYGNKGSVLLRTGALDSAIFFLNLSYQINIQPKYENEDALLTHLKLASAYLAKKQLNPAFDALTAIKKEIDTIYHPNESDISLARLMYQYYELANEPIEAFRYYKRYIQLTDSAATKNNSQLRADINLALAGKEREYQVKLLQKQNKLSRLYLWVAITFLAMAIVIVYLVYRNFRKSKKNIEALTLLNNQVSDQKMLLEKKNQEKDKILQIVAHDLRNPISGIKVLTELVLENEQDESNRNSLQIVTNASVSALTLINELLELDMASEESMSMEVADLNDLVQQSTALFRSKAEEKKQELICTVPATNIPVLVSSQKIMRVLGNIIANAIKFSPRDASIKILVKTSPGKALVEITDSGIGIPLHLQPYVFDMFTKAKRNGTANEKPFGLGLSICKQIVKAHKGRIYFESADGKGSTFIIELPLYQ